jgi:hypothetical protein
MSGYVEISLKEMKEFLESQGFRMHKRDTKTEWVANKILEFSGNNYVIRVYTTINPDNVSRGVGSDAIRVGVFSSNGEWLFGSKRVNRTKNWKSSIEQRIFEISSKLIERQTKYQSAEQI